MQLTTDRSNSSYGQPVLVGKDGTPYGVSDAVPNGQTSVQYVQSHPRCGPVDMRRRYINLYLASTGQDLLPEPARKPTALRGEAATMAAYTGHKGPATVAAVLTQIPDDLKQRLTGHELGLVMSAVNAAYHNGRKSHGGIDLCDDCIWLPWGGGQGEDGKERGQLVSIAAIRSIQIIETREPNSAQPKHMQTQRVYKMDYAETVQ